ncbi:MAG: hypothetical protein QFC55_04125 [Chloroflexota bacterium]|nr:hypothetical protein [Chloroflexota bacterium]
MTNELGPAAGRELLDDLGFLLVPGPPLAVGRSYLFVAIRPQPTLRHFDPEQVEYWMTPSGHGVPAVVEWATREAPAGEHSWGPIHVVDRLGATNEFVTFGGERLVARLPEAKFIVFSSAAPIVACGGHSQEWAGGGREIQGFLGRMRAAADPRGALEQRIATLSPTARYAAFLADALERARRSEEKTGWASGARPVLERERVRLEAESAADWASGVGLAAEVLE